MTEDARAQERDQIAAILEPVGGLHWDQRVLDLFAGCLDLGLTSAECEDARRLLRRELQKFGEEVAQAQAVRLAQLDTKKLET